MNYLVWLQYFILCKINHICHLLPLSTHFNGITTTWTLMYTKSWLCAKYHWKGYEQEGLLFTNRGIKNFDTNQTKESLQSNRCIPTILNYSNNTKAAELHENTIHTSSMLDPQQNYAHFLMLNALVSHVKFEPDKCSHITIDGAPRSQRTKKGHFQKVQISTTTVDVDKTKG